MAPLVRKVVGYFTPAKSNIVDSCTPEFGVVEEVPSVYISRVGHITLGIVYSIFLFGYVSFLIWHWTQRPTYHEYSQLDAEDWPIRNIRLFAECTHAPRCGDVNFTLSYAAVPACRSIPPQQVFIPASQTGTDSDLSRYGVNLTLCFTGDPVFNTHLEPLSIPGVTLSFSQVEPITGAAAQGVVRVSQVMKDRSLRPVRLVNMDRRQVKTLLLTQSLEQDHGEFVSSEVLPVGIQYDGKHASSRATFILAATPYVSSINKWRTHWLSIIGTFGSCAMAAWVVFVIMIWIMPLWPIVFPSEAQKLLNGQRKDQ